MQCEVLIFCQSGIRETWAPEGLSRWRVYIMITTTAVSNHKSIVHLESPLIMPRTIITKYPPIFIPKQILHWSSSHLEIYYSILMYHDLPNVIFTTLLTCKFQYNGKSHKKASIRRFLECSPTLTSFNEAFNQQVLRREWFKSDIYTPHTKKKGRTNQKSFWAGLGNENTA